MRVIAVSCNQCGAPLQVPAKTRFLTCGFCSSRLEVHRDGDAIYSEVLESIEQKTNQIADDVEAIKLQNELERLDREWMADQAQLMVRGKHGVLHVPTEAGASIAIVLVVIFSSIWILFAAGIAPCFIPFGLVFLAVGVLSAMKSMEKAKMWRERKIRFESDRRQILNQLRQRGGTS